MGRDNNQQGQGRSGQGQGGKGYQAKTTWSYGNKGPEMKFYPHGSGRKGQSVTYATTLFHSSKGHIDMVKTLQFH